MIPKLSIITSTLNADITFSCLLESIRNQYNSDIEFIVIDGGSKDRTIDLIKLNSDIISYYISEPDSGIYNAWNKGVKISKGEWISFVGADDIFCDDAISGYLSAIGNSKPGTEYISSRVRYHPNKSHQRIIGEAWMWPAFQKHMTVAHVGSVHHRSLFEKYGYFDESYQICGDYEFLLRPRSLLRADFFNQITANMGGDGKSNNYLTETFKETARAKITSGGRSRALSNFEAYIGLIKSSTRALLGF